MFISPFAHFNYHDKHVSAPVFFLINSRPALSSRFSKKYNLDREDLSNYRPISHLSFLSKLTERVVKIRLTQHLSSNNLLNKFQSAYTEHHSTESTLLAVHDHIIKAMSQQQVTALFSWISLLPSIPSIILFSSIAQPLGLASTAKSSPGSHLTYHHVLS